MFVDFGVLDHAGLVDDEGGTFGDAAHDEIGFGEELLIGDAVGFGDLMFVIAEQRDGDAFLCGPSGLGEWVVAGNAKNDGVERLVVFDAGGDFAEFGGANAGEGHGHKEKDDIGFADELAQLNEFGPNRSLGDESEVWGLVANVDGHGGFWGCRGDGGSIEQFGLRCHTNFHNVVVILDAAAGSRN